MSEDRNDQEEKLLGISDYLFIFHNHYKKIIFIISLGLLIGLYISFSTKPIYEAKLSILFKEKPGAAMVMDFGGSRDQDRLNNEIQKIKSRALAKEVVKRFWNSKRQDKMFLFNKREYILKGESYRNLIKKIVSFGLYKSKKKAVPDPYTSYSNEIGEKYADQIISNLSIGNLRASDMVELKYRSVNADEARRIVNMVAIAYQDLEKKWGNEDAYTSVIFLEKLLDKKELELKESEEFVKNFKITNNIFDILANSTFLEQQLATIETDLYNVQAEININKQRIKLLNSNLSKDEKSLAKKISNNIEVKVKTLRMEISSLESQLLQNKIVHGENHSAIIEQEKKIKELKEELNKNIQLLIAGGFTIQDPLESRQISIAELLLIESKTFGLELKKIEYQKLTKIYNDKLRQLPNKQLEFSRLQRDVTVLTSSYTYLRQKLEEANIKSISMAGKVQIIDSARLPKKPISPNHTKDFFVTFLISLLSTLGIVFFIEVLDNTVKNPDDITSKGLIVLGVIPSIGNEKTKFSFMSSKGIINTNIERRLITREDPKSPISEAYRSLRTSLLYSETGKQSKSILVSSAGPGEGKTTTVANMAITYANLGKKTLLIDTDLRRPVIHKVFNLQKDLGITNYLTGNEKDFDKLIQKTKIENLFSVTSGIIPPNPSELLGSEKMSKLIKNLEEQWDLILFDSPPLVAVTDATMISKEIDKIIMVVKVGHTDKRAFNHTIQSLRNIGAPLGGVVLNAVTQKNTYGAYYYYYQYYNYYGSDKKST